MSLYLQRFKVILRPLTPKYEGDTCHQNVRNHRPSNAALHVRSPSLHCYENVQAQCVLSYHVVHKGCYTAFQSWIQSTCNHLPLFLCFSLEKPGMGANCKWHTPLGRKERETLTNALNSPHGQRHSL